MDFFLRILQIIFIDLALSGDNAVVIGMAAHRLSPPQRKKAIFFGGGAAIVLRVVLTGVATFLLALNGLQLVGGLLLIWIGFKMLKEEEESQEGIKVASGLKEAIVTILIADFVMSLDNVVGVAVASKGSIELLIFGLVFSMVILMFMGTLVANLINKLSWLVYAGSGIIVWTGAETIFKDGLVVSRWEWVHGTVERVASVLITMVTLALAHWYHRMRKRSVPA